MEKKDLVEGMRLYIYKLRVDGRYSTAKSYQREFGIRIA